jgi:hypothetical protein
LIPGLSIPVVLGCFLPGVGPLDNYQRTWLMGSPWPISVISDHHNLLYFMSSQVLNCCQVHWAMFLSEFDFKLIWGPGVENVADSPSCHPNFIPKKGGDVLLGQHQLILTPSYTQQVLPSPEFLSTNLPPLFIPAQSLHSPSTTQFFSNVSRLCFMKILSGKSLLFMEIPTSLLKAVWSSTTGNFSSLNLCILTFFFLIMIPV